MATQLPRFDSAALNRALVGFDRLFDTFESRFGHQLTTNYPPYNVLKHDENHYTIELAVAGFSKNDITVEIDDSALTIAGNKDKSNQASEESYVYRGLSSRNFLRRFQLAEHMQIESASIKDGILIISLVRIVPEEKKPRLIEITEAK